VHNLGSLATTKESEIYEYNDISSIHKATVEFLLLKK